METTNAKPELYKANDLMTYRQWITLMEEFGHIWFYLDGSYYFLFPLGDHRYGMCLGEDEATGNLPRWKFDSEEEFIHVPMFGGKSILERAADVLSWDPPFFSTGKK